MKWYSINLDEHLNHKILFTSIPEDGEEYGISGICINDELFFGEKLSIECGAVLFDLCGSTSDKDNLVCASQHIKVGLDKVKKIAFLGFNEFGNYGDRFMIIEKDGNAQNRHLFFYGFNQFVETLYTSEMNEFCSEAVKTMANGYLNVNLYKYEITLEDLNIEEIVLPENIEMHIMAVSVFGD